MTRVLGIALILFAILGITGSLTISLWASLTLAVFGILFICVGTEVGKKPEAGRNGRINKWG